PPQTSPLFPYTPRFRSGYINGTPCPQGDLKALGELLIDIHSQHEHQSLLKLDTHRRLLDEYGGCQDLARQVQMAAQRWRQTRQTERKRTRLNSSHVKIS